MANETETKRLTGKALLQKLKEIEHLSRREKARECGYITLTKSGEVRVSSGEFLSALLEAKGISLDTGNERSGRGREATYRVSVHQNGQILIGQAYTQKMGLKPGDEFEIKLGYKHIHLAQAGGEDEAS